MFWLAMMVGCMPDLGDVNGSSAWDDGSEETLVVLDTAGLSAADSASAMADIRIVSEDPCTNPCTLRAEASDDIVAARYEADGRLMGHSQDFDLRLTYNFPATGVVEITVYGRNQRGIHVAEQTRWIRIVDANMESDLY